MPVHVCRPARAASVAALLAALLVVAPRVGRAQAPAAADSLPFARGQWGVQVTGGASLVSVGALRFTSPRAAWLLDVAAGVTRSETRVEPGPDSPLPPDAGASQVTSSGGANVRVGRRYYRPLGRSVATFATAGVSASYAGARSTQPGSLRTTTLGGGLFGDLGATYFVTPHLGLGASVTLDASYARSRGSGGGATARASSVGVQLQRPLALVTLFF